MKILKLTALAAVLAIGSFTAKAQSADEIISKHIAAVGGEDAWNKINSMKMEIKMSTPQADIDLTTVVLKDKAGMIKQSAMGQEMVMVVNPSSGWMMMGDKIKDMEEEQREGLYHQMEDLKIEDELMAAKAKKFTIIMAGKEKVGDKEAYKLIVTDADGDDHNYFVDTKNYYIIRHSQMVNVEGQQMESGIMFSDFKKLPEGITMAMKQEVGDEGITMTTKKVEINTITDEKLFDKPAK